MQILCGDGTVADLIKAKISLVFKLFVGISVTRICQVAEDQYHHPFLALLQSLTRQLLCVILKL